MPAYKFGVQSVNLFIILLNVDWYDRLILLYNYIYGKTLN